MEELSIVKTVLDQQLEVLRQMREAWDILKLSKKNQISMQSIYNSRKQVKKLKSDLQELEGMAEKTSTLVRCSMWLYCSTSQTLIDPFLQARSMIEVRKETNNKAIIVFTVVTVIFLPMSFVTSYLGMNSVDIRNGTFKQSLFWIIALPSAVCLLVFLWLIIYRVRLSVFLLYVKRLFLRIRRVLYGVVLPRGFTAGRTNREPPV